MKKIVLVCFTIVFSLCAFAQENFQEGYVVMANGDTLKGRVNNLLWSESPGTITFSGTNGVTRYRPEDLLGFSAGAHTMYRSFKVNIDTTGGVGGDRSKSMAPTFFEQHVFQQVIIDSKFSLLKYKQGFRTHFFLQEQGYVPEELISHAAERTIAGKTLMQPGNQFIGQLKEKMGDCPNVPIDMNMRFLESVLTEFFKKYNECKSSVVYLPGDEPKKGYIGVVASGHRDSFGSDYSQGIGYSGGIFFELNYPKGFYKTSWYTEAVYYKYGEQSSPAVRFHLGTLKITTLVKSSIIDGPTRGYLLGGLGRAFSSTNSKIYINNKEAPGKIRGHWNLTVGFGAYVTRALSAELRVERTTPVIYEQDNSGLGGGAFSSGGIGFGNGFGIGLHLALHLEAGK